MVIIGDGPIALLASRGPGLRRGQIFIWASTTSTWKSPYKLGADHKLYANRTLDRWPSSRTTPTAPARTSCWTWPAPQAPTEGFKMLRQGGRFSAFGIAPNRPAMLDYNAGIVFKGAQIHGINGRKMFDTWYRVRNLLASGRLDIRPVITHMFTPGRLQEGFDAMLGRPRQSAKVVLFPAADELDAAKKRM